MPEFEEFEVPIQVGIVSDTHRSSRNPKALPDALLKGLDGCDLILHLGDLNAPWVLEILGRIAPVRAVHGNNEEPPLGRRLPSSYFIRAGGFRIGLMHGHGSYLPAREFTFKTMHEHVECAIYGHSHQPEIAERDGLLMVNPGSPTQRRFAPHHTYAIMTVEDEISAEIVVID